MAFPADPLDLLVEAFYGATWNDITDYVFDRDGRASVTISRGRANGASRCDPGQAVLKLNNADGRFSPRNPRSPLYGLIGRNTPLRISYIHNSTTYIKFTGEVVAWPSRWDPSGSDVWVQLEAWGILRRLGQGATPLKSALRRTILASSPAPIAYWPMEDSIRAGTAASGLPGGSPMTGSIRFQSADGPPGSDQVVSISSGGEAWGPITGCSTALWTVEHVALWPDTDTAAANSMSIQVDTTGTVPSWRISANDSPDVVRLSYLPPASTVYTALDSTAAGFNGEWKHIIFEATQSGPDVNVSLAVNGNAVLSATLAGQTMGAITRVGLSTAEDVPDGEIPAVGHVTVWSGAPVTADTPAAATGWDGELVTDRLTRLCAEEDISIVITGTSSARMGPQRIATPLDLLDDCAAVDLGFLHEQRDAVGLAYRTNSSRYNQAALTVDYSLDQIFPPFEPMPDDRGIVNSVEVRMRDGTSVWVEERTGPLSVQSPPDGVGRYHASLTADACEAGQLADIANWVKTLGTQDVERYTAVRLNLAATPELLAAASVIDSQDRLVITGLPEWMPPEADLIVEGYEETLSQSSLDITLNTSPGNLYQQIGRWGLLAHELHTAIDDSTTTIDIATTSTMQPLLETRPALIGSGYSVTVGGEEMQVTAVAASTITFGAVGTAAHGNNASVVPSLPASLAQGNLMVMVAAIRNFGAGTPNTPSGWTRLAVFPASANVQIFAKIAGSSESAPTVSFTGGVAGADTTAQIIRLTGKWHSTSNILVGAACRLNPSAQNIIVPGLSRPDVENYATIGVGWKQDDWTSVAQRAGWIEIDEPDTTAGDDQGIVWDYAILTSPLPAGPQEFTVTGGASAISRGAVFALRCDYQTATVTRGVNGFASSHSAGDAVTATKPMRWGLI